MQLTSKKEHLQIGLMYFVKTRFIVYAPIALAVIKQISNHHSGQLLYILLHILNKLFVYPSYSTDTNEPRLIKWKVDEKATIGNRYSRIPHP